MDPSWRSLAFCWYVSGNTCVQKKDKEGGGGEEEAKVSALAREMAKIGAVIFARNHCFLACFLRAALVRLHGSELPELGLLVVGLRQHLH